VNSFAKTVSELSFTEDHSVSFIKERSVSSCINEYYNKNKIVADEKKKFEETFKKKLDAEVDLLLQGISKEVSIAKRLSKFKEVFPEYFSFITQITSSFDIKLKI
jgi:hypothetical protein